MCGSFSSWNPNDKSYSVMLLIALLFRDCFFIFNSLPWTVPEHVSLKENWLHIWSFSAFCHKFPWFFWAWLGGGWAGQGRDARSVCVHFLGICKCPSATAPSEVGSFLWESLFSGLLAFAVLISFLTDAFQIITLFYLAF